MKEESLIYNPQTSFPNNEPTDVGLGIKPKSTLIKLLVPKYTESFQIDVNSTSAYLANLTVFGSLFTLFLCVLEKQQQCKLRMFLFTSSSYRKIL